MSIEDELAAFFNEEPERVVADSQQFRLKLGIGVDAYKTLSKICDLSPMLSGGAMASGAGFLGLQGTAGAFAFIGFGSTPIGWVALAGVAGAGVFYGGSQLLKKARKGAVQEIPKYLNSPIDVIASSILSFIAPIAFKLAKLDGVVSQAEREFVSQYFVNEWGFDEKYVNSQLDTLIDSADEIDFDKVSNKINELVTSGDVNKDELIKQVVELSEKLCQIDQSEHDETEVQLQALKQALMYGQSEWQTMATQHAEKLQAQAKEAASSTLEQLNTMGSFIAEKSKVLAENSAEMSKQGAQNLAPKMDELKQKSSGLMNKAKGLFNK